MRAGEQTRQRGLTLVELMVAMVAALVLMAGAVQVFIANKVTMRTQDGIARVQEAGRFAMGRLGDAVRNAGFFGCAGLDVVTPKVLARNPPADLTQFTTGTPIWGMDNVTSGNTLNGVALNAAVGTDVVSLRGVANGSIGLTGNLTPINANIQIDKGYDGFQQNELVLVTDCQTADLVRKTNALGSEKSGSKETIAHAQGANANIDNRLSKPYGADAFVLRPAVDTFYVKDTGRDNAAGQDVLALYQRDINGNDWEIVEGVSDMQILYGVDMDGNRNADRHMTAAQVTAGSNWDRVVNVRISLLADSVDGVLEAPASYVFMPSGTTPITPATGDHRLRQEFTGVFTLRNRAL